jgi:Zn-dependent protease with chaperone function
MGRVIAQGADILGVLGSLSLPVQFGLQYWSRRSELSADRAAALVMGSASPVVETMIRLAGGPKKLTAAVDAEAYAAQADAYDTLQRDSTWDKVLQGVATANLSHPFPAVRTREILRWSRTEHFSRLRAALGHDAGDRNTHQPACVRCGANIEATWRFCQSCGASLPS